MDSLTLQRMCRSFYLILRDASLTSRSLESSASICTQVCVRVSLPGVQRAASRGLGPWRCRQKECAREGWEGGEGRLFRFSRVLDVSLCLSLCVVYLTLSGYMPRHA